MNIPTVFDRVPEDLWDALLAFIMVQANVTLERMRKDLFGSGRR